MTLNDIETAVGQHLSAITDVPDIAWPNDDFTPSGPYIEFRHAPNDSIDDTISGGFEYQTGLFLLTVVTKKNDFTTDANTLASKVKAQFPYGLRLSAGDGTVLINRPTSPGTPFPDGAYWRQPLRISYITEG
jgi:hypothetical protein